MRNENVKIFSNIKDLRKLLRLTQKEFATLLGVSQVYISHIETYRRPLKLDLAEQIANELYSIVGKVFHVEMNKNQSLDTDWELLHLITPDYIHVEHEASKFSQDIQYKLFERMVEKRKLDLEIDYMLKKGQEPSKEEMEDYCMPYESIEPLKSIVNYMLRMKSSKVMLEKLKSDLQKDADLSSIKSGKGLKYLRG